MLQALPASSQRLQIARQPVPFASVELAAECVTHFRLENVLVVCAHLVQSANLKEVYVILAVPSWPRVEIVHHQHIGRKREDDVARAPTAPVRLSLDDADHPLSIAAHIPTSNAEDVQVGCSTCCTRVA
eukprot:CAMPEP_0181174092 /NCGR_PEP_ID=MMETSP1096-20121128/3350_1 /TAXON_ID=156174 ORGANISM="Chrysochromulina ericina, Strain CCMP281" /NCGR_SAMPLE_ID=MMETSP1096 /ASSEMBLY_ACC=CAM_ASM_000453 /LENGTH=128 /DNA_ID=CAMNT_0023261967 /DNA_START=432 /DNA_END=815 /DNA_ORIENTATION=+